MSHAVRKLTKKKLSEDVVVPRMQIGELLDRVRAPASRPVFARSPTATRATAICTVTSCGTRTTSCRASSARIEQLFKDVIELRGTLSGEHGIGVLKSAYLPLEQAPELITLQRDLKRVFDPGNLLNPGKIFPAGSHRAC